MGIRATAAAGVLAVAVLPAQAQAQSGDERAIRELIAQYDRAERVARTDDAIVWTGDQKEPTVGARRGEPLPLDRRPSSAQRPGASAERVPGGRRRVTTPVRIDIAQSGDLAFEFSYSELRFDLKDGTQETVLPASVMRVWKKEGGQWKIAAMFARPHDDEPAAPAAK